VNKPRSGFTLLELLVVVGILAALVALALPFYQDYVSQSKITAAGADLQTFKKALAMYDQLEPKMFVGSDLLPLIGKYLQDYRLLSDQENPVDPWGNDYKIDSSVGVVYSMGPNGKDDSSTDDTLKDRNPSKDDIMVSWKPDFFVSSVSRINDTTMDVSFSRKVSTLGNTDVTVTAGPIPSTSVQKISDTQFRAKFGGVLPTTGTVSVLSTVVAQDFRALSVSRRPEDVFPAKTADKIDF